MPLPAIQMMTSGNPESGARADVERKLPTDPRATLYQPKRSVMIPRSQETFAPSNPNRYIMMLWSDPEKTLQRPHDSVVSAAIPDALTVPSNRPVAIPKIVFAAISSPFVCSHLVKRPSDDPALM